MLLTVFAIMVTAPIIAFSQEEQAIDIVFDLDWTLINPTTEKMAEAVPENIFRFGHEVYRLTDHTVETLVELHSQKNVRISFFSGGARERNEAFVKWLYERIHTRQKNDQFKPYLVLSTEHLTTVSTDKNLRFPQRYKKDLSRYFNILRAILIDDIKNFIMPGQELNEVWLGKTYNDRPRFELKHLENEADDAYSAPDEEEWRRDRNKLLFIKDMILAALKEAENNPDLFLEKLNQLKIQFSDAAVLKCQILFAG